MGIYKPSIFHSNDEAKGYIICTPTRVILFMSMSYLTVAMQHLANIEVGCTGKGYSYGHNATMDRVQTEVEANVAEIECTGKKWGLSPLSLMSTVLGVGSVTISIVIPVVGALIDFTDRRKSVFLYSWYTFWLTNFVQIGVAQSTWVYMGIIQAFVGSASFITHIVASVSYANEITDNDADMIDLMSAARLWELTGERASGRAGWRSGAGGHLQQA